ncbi:MAG: DUF1801 domain-containing protein [Polyangiaceae bacterium]|nr:DUF1801 domain-containing protein [Polyangiaceae bacterium]
MPTRNRSTVTRHETPRPARKARAPAAPRKRASEGLRRAASIDEYLAGVPSEKRVVLEKLRQTIRKVVPDADECISYAIPAFRLRGEVVAGFAATARGCSYFPFSGSTLGALGDTLQGYDKTRSALHFTLEKPLPVGLVRKLVKARVAETRE